MLLSADTLISGSTLAADGICSSAVGLEFPFGRFRGFLPEWESVGVLVLEIGRTKLGELVGK